MCAIPSTLINKQQAFPTANIQWQCGCYKTTQQRRNMVALGVGRILIRTLLSVKKKNWNNQFARSFICGRLQVLIC